MNCYAWELEALLEGLTLKALDEQERSILFGFNMRYIMNAKKPKFSKMLNKQKQENKIKDLFKKKPKDNNTSKVKSVIDALNHFKNRR